MPKREDCLLRPMRESDLEMVLQWRNSERIREVMYTDHVISIEEHRAWFERASREKRSLHFVFECEEQPVGVVNVADMDKINNKCVWGFYVGAEEVPRGAGSAMGFFALEHLFENMGFRKVIGEALANNEASIKYHLRLGFVEEGRLVEHILKNDQYIDIVSFAIFDRTWYEIKGRLAGKFFVGGR